MTRSNFKRQPLSKVVSRYDRIARWYRFGEWTILLAPGFRRQAVARLELKPGDRVIEFGCGTGRNLALLRNAVTNTGEVIGVDASPGMLTEAQKTISRRHWPNVRLIEQDAAEFTPDEPADLAYFSLSYSVMPDRHSALDHAWASLRDGGRLAIMDAGIPDTNLGRMLAPLAEIVATVFPGDPYSEPWRDLTRLAQPVQTERFQRDLYFLCSVQKPSQTHRPPSLSQAKD